MKKIFLSLILTIPMAATASNGKEGIRSKIKEHLPEIQACYKNSLTQSPDNKGKIVVDWEVNDLGDVTKVTVNEKKTTLKDATVHSCITNNFKSWKFPPAPKGQVVTASYPFVFSK